MFWSLCHEMLEKLSWSITAMMWAAEDDVRAVRRARLGLLQIASSGYEGRDNTVSPEDASSDSAYALCR